MQASSLNHRDKLAETIQKSSELLICNKHYEFAQKIKMLAQRKTQTQKHTQAEGLLILAIAKMFSVQNIELNATHDLVDTLLILYQSQPNLWKQTSAHQIYELLTKKQNPKNVDYFSRIVKKIAEIKSCPQMAQFIISHFQKNQLFQLGQSFVVHLELPRVTRFLQKWHQKVDNEEYTILICRMALLKGLFYDFDQVLVLLSEVDAQNPFVKFVRFLVQTVQLKSRECFQKIGIGYKKFFETDSFFGEMYQSYGIKYFKNQKKGGLSIL